MTTSKRIALPIAVALHILLLYAFGKINAHLVQTKATGEPLVISLIPLLPTQSARVEPRPPHLAAATPRVVPRSMQAAAPQAVAVPVPVTAETKAAESPPANAGTGLLALAALNAVGKLDREERGGAAGGGDVMSNSLAARLSASIDKNAKVPAGTIDENIYPDGRREERVYTGDAVYCITYESPSDPKDGFDTIQRGLKPSVPHTCGHRFDR